MISIQSGEFNAHHRNNLPGSMHRDTGRSLTIRRENILRKQRRNKNTFKDLAGLTMDN